MPHAFVNVIESPSSADLLDGRTEGRMLIESLNLAQIPNAYSLVTDRETLVTALEVRLREAARYHNKIPIMHFSMHGNAEGIQLTDGTFVAWGELRDLLSPLMQATQGTLLICMSSCAGNAGARMAMTAERQPNFWALVGNTGEATWSDAAIAFSSFYHLFFKDLDINVCVDSMKVASADHNFVINWGEQIRLNWLNYLLEQGAQQIQAAVEGGNSE